MAAKKDVLPEVVYFSTYMAIAGNRLYDRDWFLIDNMINGIDCEADVREGALAIIMDKPNKPMLQDVINQLAAANEQNRKWAIWFGLKIAIGENQFRTREQEAFEKLRVRFRIDKKEYESMIDRAQKIADGTVLNSTDEAHKKKLEKRYGNCLFSTRDYAKAVQRMQTIAMDDIHYTAKRVQEVAALFREHPKLLNEQVKQIRKYEKRMNNEDEKQQLEDFFTSLFGATNKILARSERNLRILCERQERTSACYTVSFMGRTKAGKSTLHSVLLGGINNGFIGRGSERTTRYNYIYDFHGLRMIDTPGIGAPGGKDDTQIAEEVCDESDLICYVVTSDSIQETEFNFLKHLRDKNKPVIILLNKKENFTRSAKKKAEFLEDPLDWYTRGGEDSIQGHIDRINTYITKNFDYHNFSIVPVHLLAAKCALAEEDPQAREKYMIGSRMDLFLQELKEMVNTSGTIQRSMTVYNAAIYHMMEDTQAVEDQIQLLKTLRNELEHNRDLCFKRIVAAKETYRNELITSCNSIYEYFLQNDVRSFSYSHYGANRKQLDEEWKKFCKENGLEEKIQAVYEHTWSQYRQKVEEVSNESAENLQFSMSYGSLSDVKMGLVFDVKTTMELTASIISVFAFIAGANPVGTILAGVALAMGFAGIFIKSKAKMIQDRQREFYEVAEENLEKTRVDNLRKLLSNYDEQCKKVETGLGEYYTTLISTIGEIEEKLKGMHKVQKQDIMELNQAVAARIVNYMTSSEVYRISNENSMKKLKVERDFRKQIKITDPVLFVQPVYVKPERISDILQERVVIAYEEDDTIEEVGEL